MTGPVRSYLGETRLELGPARDAPRKNGWRVAQDSSRTVWLVLDTGESGANTVSRGVLEELERQLDRLEQTPPRALVIRSAKTAGFAAGADISMFDGMTEPEKAVSELEWAHGVVDRLSALDCPKIAVVHGAALGAGFEIVLACDHCIAIEGASFGFPEVNLGLHPGLGGTFRLPERIDTTEAMTMMLSGKTVHTRKARALGIADEVTLERHVLNAVEAAVKERSRSGGRSFTDIAMDFSAARGFAARQMRAKTESRAPKAHYPAPHALIDLWEQHHGDRAAMQSGEIASFARLLETNTSQELVRVFHLRQRLKSAAAGTDGIGHVHIAGAGAMGADIAAWCAINGKYVTLSDPSHEALGNAVETAGNIARGAHLDARKVRDALDRLVPDPNGYGVPRADLVIEAGPEDLDIKREIHAGLEPRMSPNATLTTNTSSLSLAALAEPLKRPSRFAGLHFFNPVAKLPLVEVVRHDGTYKTVLSQLSAFCGTLGKLPVAVADTPGFLVNRALTPYLLEALVLIDEGVGQERIDAAAERFGMPTGPVELADRIGLDICLDVADSLEGRLETPLPEVPGWFRERVMDEKALGKKTDRGLYTWEDGKPRKDDAGGSDTPELTERLILPMLNACMTCLRTEVVEDADMVDAAMIFGTGFAPFRGGPMRYARNCGVDEIRSALKALQDKHGDRFAPDPGWNDIS